MQVLVRYKIENSVEGNQCLRCDEGLGFRPDRNSRCGRTIYAHVANSQSLSRDNRSSGAQACEDSAFVSIAEDVFRAHSSFRFFCW